MKEETKKLILALLNGHVCYGKSLLSNTEEDSQEEHDLLIEIYKANNAIEEVENLK